MVRDAARRRPGGVIVGNAPFMYWVHEAPHDYHRYTEYALRAAVEEAGGELVELEAIGGSAEVFSDFIGKHLGAVPLVGHTLARLLAVGDPGVRAHTAGRAVSRRDPHEVPARLHVGGPQGLNSRFAPCDAASLMRRNAPRGVCAA